MEGTEMSPRVFFESKDFAAALAAAEAAVLL
jgi:hypothetical protein